MQHWVVYYVDYEDSDEDGTFFGPFFEEDEALDFIKRYPPEIGGWEYTEVYCVNAPCLMEMTYDERDN